MAGSGHSLLIYTCCSPLTHTRCFLHNAFLEFYPLELAHCQLMQKPGSSNPLHVFASWHLGVESDARAAVDRRPPDRPTAADQRPATGERRGPLTAHNDDNDDNDDATIDPVRESLTPSLGNLSTLRNTSTLGNRSLCKLRK